MSPAPAAQKPAEARFISGSIMRHVLVMSSTSSIGLVFIFLVDFANLFYISLFHDPRLTAAVGYAGAILYFHISFSIGLMIAAVALTSRAIGGGDPRRAREVAGSALAIVGLVSGAMTLVSLPFIDWMLTIIGAEGETKAAAAWLILLGLPTTPLFGLGMCLVGILRAAGDARRSMYATLILGLTTAALDPILIYAMGLGITGAGLVMVISRVLMIVYAFWVATQVHDLVARPSLAGIRRDFMPLARVGVPAVLTNIATPVSAGYVTAVVAGFGDHAVAGWAIVSRLTPVAFGVLFALSGAVAPIIGQNFGAGAFDRVRRTLGDSMIFAGVYTLAVSLLLFAGRNVIIEIFGVSGDDAALVLFFCQFLAISYMFSAGLFVSNAAFNNLGFPLLSTLFNWGRATIGTIPFVWAGARLAGAEGALAGFAIGSVPFGIVALYVSNRIVNRLAKGPNATAPAPVWWDWLSTLARGQAATVDRP